MANVKGSDRRDLKKRILTFKMHGPTEFSSAEKAGFHRLKEDVRRSISSRIRRQENLPNHTVHSNLPIAEKAVEIIEAIAHHQVCIISGQTGSGKTTQIPKLCLAAGRGIDGIIGCTQPRRIAATSVAERIAEEMGEDIGRSVGYKIRFDERFSPDGFIKIMTDGILLSEAQSDPMLNAYDTIIVDEAHERSLNIDFILGIVKKLLRKRNDLKLIITSATLDTEKFSAAFDDAPVIEVSGRLFPVEVRHVDPASSSGEDLTPVELTVNAAEKLLAESTSGDVLIFMPTEQDIRETCEILEAKPFDNLWVIPLFARLSVSEQKKVFARSGARKIIVATNIAETSITIPNIRYVIDTGLARISRYIPRTRTTELPVEPVSRSSADQRMGRCGRVQNGICIRLFSKEDYESRPRFTIPEILRSSLAEVILRMIALNLGDVERFPFIDPPDFKSIRDGYELLKELQAIEENRKKAGKNRFSLTEKGKLMARLPLDPRISRMLIEAKKEGVLSELIVIGSALSIQDPRERPIEKEAEADLAHRMFHHPRSDFLSLLTIWKQYAGLGKKEKTTGALRRFCKRHFLSFRKMREWGDIRDQIQTMLLELGWQAEDPCNCNDTNNDALCQPEQTLYAGIHKSILSGYLSNIAFRKQKNIYQGTKGKTVMVFPGSCLFNGAAGEWIVSAEMVETSRLFARTCAVIQNEWLEPLGGSLCSRTHDSPHWDKQRGEVSAYEQVTLFGMKIVPRRSISFEKIDPAKASDIFIREAIMEGELSETFPFMIHNQKMTDRVLDLENRLRRRDVLVGREDVFRFYRKRIGQDVYDLKSFKKLIHRNNGDHFLHMSQEDLISNLPELSELALYPDSMELGSESFLCEYKFDPGGEKDGVTVRIPVEKIPSVKDSQLDWHIPGMLREKISTLLKGLPKSYRKQLVPISKTSEIILAEMPNSRESLSVALSRFIGSRFDVNIPPAAWQHEIIPEYLKIRVEITNAAGKALGAGRSPKVLENIAPEGHHCMELERLKTSWEKENLLKWEFDEIPEHIALEGKNSAKLVYYPALQRSEDGRINLRLFQNLNLARKSHPNGVCALYRRRFSKELKFLKKTLVIPKDLEQPALCFGGSAAVERRLYESVVETLFQKDIRTRKDFEAYGPEAVSRLQATGLEALRQCLTVIRSVYAFRMTLSRLEPSDAGAGSLMSPLREELARLVPENFMAIYSPRRIADLIRFIKAMEIRAERMVANPGKDSLKSQKVRRFTERFDELLTKLTPEITNEKQNALEELFWMIEEYKVSVFAQELKTSSPVSEKRILSKFAEISVMV